MLRVWECAGVGDVRAGVGVVGVATYGSLCDGDMWGESGRVGCIRSRVSVGDGGEEVQVGVFGVGQMWVF